MHTQYVDAAATSLGLTITSFRDARSYPNSGRSDLMDSMNAIIAINWEAKEPHWTADFTPFQNGFGLALAEHDGRLVAFSVYRLLSVRGCRALYRSGTEVLPQYQGRGLYEVFTREALSSARQDTGPIFYGWRTRNPIVWTANAKYCTKVVPSLLDENADPSLVSACTEMCSILYPRGSLEVPRMIMRGAYGHISHRPQKYHGAAALVERVMNQTIPDSRDALFSVGIVGG